MDIYPRYFAHVACLKERERNRETSRKKRERDTSLFSREEHLYTHGRTGNKARLVGRSLKRCLLKNPSDVVTDKYRFDKSLAGGTSIWLTFSDPIRISSSCSTKTPTRRLLLLLSLPFPSPAPLPPSCGVGSGFRCAGLRVVHA